ncbi:kinase-like domain-containing protein [Rhizophagus irregularis DAOM 181602=DAOM 197198]|uniref:Kinase-like domain-containing protein n=3 Tax=Rhizophagus irregularis TaxID=588596 RepID=A0A2P4P623_RHIID|nr:kinase-like domain-containing protein [Rhizophagus irregularis DAOM 181602=DAOM 197198]POG60836.1 kinase-like domain-containing protein [Rhizophagus irregularis DAOM 181602=DAOM 197198]|eukprot:XP_025167702.1 kinase-like domain-containing protein [Rhizophagus irregularis DAOM 181602=DAOM 197198]
MMVLEYCILRRITRGLLNIHNAGLIHKDFHSGNILFNNSVYPMISDLGMCQPTNNKKQEGVYGVLPYMAPEVLCGYQYTKAADIYSFGIIMNEYMSENIPYVDIPHDHILAVKICKGFRPEIPKVIPKLITDLIIKCWDSKAENRPTAKELYQSLGKLHDGTPNDHIFNNTENSYNETNNKEDNYYFQVKKCDIIREKKLRSNFKKNKENIAKNVQTHPQAIYTSRLLNFENLPKPVNSTFQVSQCLDCELDELDLNQDDDQIQEDDN